MIACTIYRSGKKTETYLYLRNGMDFDELPAELQASFGEPAFVMQMDLSPDRRLARAETGKVLASLAEHGYYLQLPPKLPVEEEIAHRFS